MGTDVSEIASKVEPLSNANFARNHIILRLVNQGSSERHGALTNRSHGT